jgi:hypothetical protein
VLGVGALAAVLAAIAGAIVLHARPPARLG